MDRMTERRMCVTPKLSSSSWSKREGGNCDWKWALTSEPRGSMAFATCQLGARVTASVEAQQHVGVTLGGLIETMACSWWGLTRGACVSHVQLFSSRCLYCSPTQLPWKLSFVIYRNSYELQTFIQAHPRICTQSVIISWLLAPYSCSQVTSQTFKQYHVWKGGF